MSQVPLDQEALSYSNLFDRANKEYEKQHTDEAIKLFTEIVNGSMTKKNDIIIKKKEEAIYNLGKIYAARGDANAIVELNKSIRPFFQDLPKAKTAKIVRTLIELVGTIKGSDAVQIDICKESIEWATSEKRSFLRQRIESRLATLYFQKKEFAEALNIITRLLREVRKLDDKALLVEIHLLESKVYHSLRNLSKARAALTAARTDANAIYCPPLLQADIDMQSGVLHAEEKDYKTAFSYFFEAFEGFSNLEDNTAIMCLKYMLLCKVCTNSMDDIQTLLSSKTALNYTGREVESMKAVSSAYQERSLHAFERALIEYEVELKRDPIINAHLSELYDNLLEQHLLRIIEPFSRVQISHVAKLIDLPRTQVERKLSQMILDTKLNGILDQGNDCIIVYEETKKDQCYPSALETISNLNGVMDSLFERAKALTK
ncbi:hypothetical protein FDP41_006655 [Naegleria fowleri]|uniref:PCI domain-containing protein n=1 Tax=Naegleria fowleri TaxID=5763 RepID=A0A6A5BKA0_NAEFO|nr:uncharacterized protein FDP41_006655 [Naegleria fowleri]KAF0974045.1 hypothetical protein FDP41_006655 [Naegleria fowleri]CAG4708175.1 unnamed protein product [Naegleria fowleri]